MDESATTGRASAVHDSGGPRDAASLAADRCSAPHARPVVVHLVRRGGGSDLRPLLRVHPPGLYGADRRGAARRAEAPSTAIIREAGWSAATDRLAAACPVLVVASGSVAPFQAVARGAGGAA